MLGCSWYLTANDHGQWALLPLIILGASAAISYQRAKAESLGIAAKGGLMERAERMILLGAGLLIPGIFVPVLIALALLSIGTAIGRFFRIYRVIEGPEGTSFQDLVEAGHKDRTGVAERIFATPLPTEVMRQRRRRPSRRDATWRARRFERRPQAAKARRTWSARRDASSTPRSRRP
jgi:CDP-diacylglycerol--glycerol-3-phosphate 3-phosphatidyltransferase